MKLKNLYVPDPGVLFDGKRKNTFDEVADEISIKLEAHGVVICKQHDPDAPSVWIPYSSGMYGTTYRHFACVVDGCGKIFETEQARATHFSWAHGERSTKRRTRGRSQIPEVDKLNREQTAEERLEEKGKEK